MLVTKHDNMLTVIVALWNESLYLTFSTYHGVAFDMAIASDGSLLGT